jgi:hypothetical protein
MTELCAIGPTLNRFAGKRGSGPRRIGLAPVRSLQSAQLVADRLLRVLIAFPLVLDLQPRPLVGVEGLEIGMAETARFAAKGSPKCPALSGSASLAQCFTQVVESCARHRAWAADQASASGMQRLNASLTIKVNANLSGRWGICRRKRSSQVTVEIQPSSARFPKFVRHCGNLLYELRKAKGTSKSLILVPLSI